MMPTPTTADAYLHVQMVQNRKPDPLPPMSLELDFLLPDLPRNRGPAYSWQETVCGRRLDGKRWR